MSSLSVPHSISTISTNGDIDSGRGQLGYTAVGSLVGLVNNLWTLTTPHKPHYCVLDCLANSALQLPAIGTSSSQANLGYRVTIHNKSGANTIDVQSSTSVSIYVIPPGEVSTFTAVTAPNTWDFTTQAASSGATLQTAYDAGNTIIETPNREVLIRDDAGFNQTVLTVQAADAVPVLEIGNAVPGLNTPYIKEGYGQLTNPQADTLYRMSSGPFVYNSTSDDQGRQVSFMQLNSSREIFGSTGKGLGVPQSSIVRDVMGASQISLDSVNSVGFNFVGLPDTTYGVKWEIFIRDANAFSSIQIIFTMDNKALTNTVSSPYQEIQNSAAITVDPVITVTSFGTSGYTVSIQGPDYNPPGIKTYIGTWLITHIAFTH